MLWLMVGMGFLGQEDPIQLMPKESPSTTEDFLTQLQK